MERIEGKCDVCTKPDGSRNHNLQKCRVCSVLVHELCYGMVPTTTKNKEFICHACKSVCQPVDVGVGDGNDNEEIIHMNMVEVNVPSKVGGLNLKDVLVEKEEGVASFREYLRGEHKKTQTRKQTQNGDDDSERQLDFHVATTEFQSNNNNSDNDDQYAVKERAQHIFDTYCARDAKRKVSLSPNILSDIDTALFDGTGDPIASTLFDAARKETHESLERNPLFEKYKQSLSFVKFLRSKRTYVEGQKERPSECVLCSVKNGIHAMHPLYDIDGKEGRQLVLPASGVGFMRKEKRLAWVHTLCAMSICSNERTGSLVYGCDENGDYEDNDEDEEELDDDERDGGGFNSKVIHSDDDDDDDESIEPSSPSRSSVEEEQKRFTKCEMVFRPLMERLEEATNANCDSKDVDEILQNINSMIENVDLLTPSFIRVYQIGALLKKIKKSFESTSPKVRACCKRLSAEMKRVYNEKEKMVPEVFEPVKNLRHDNNISDQSDSRESSNGAEMKKDAKGDAKIITTDVEQKYKIGTSVPKEFDDGTTHNGKIISYTDGLYHIVYDNKDSEDLTEFDLSHRLLSYTAWFCMAAAGDGTDAGSQLKSLRELTCVICKKKDNASSKCLRIPVQCSAGDQYEFKQFKKHHNKSLGMKKKLAKANGEEYKGCTEPMHVGCARWGNDYAKVKNKSVRMCYYFSGKPPTYEGPDEFCNPVSNCFCRVHAREIQAGLGAESTASGGAAATSGKRKSVAEDDAMSDASSELEDSAEKARQLSIAIAKKKKQRRIMEETDEESD